MSSIKRVSPSPHHEVATQLENEPLPPELTPRQQEVLSLLSQGLSSDEIGVRLGISTDAVNQHIDVIRRKIGAANRTEAVAIALRKHLLKKYITTGS